MSFGLILGRAGSGKTETCIRQIGAGLKNGAKEEFVLLTPEQATFANEKRVLATLGGAGGFQVKVLSFRRFVHWVLQETEGGRPPVLDTVGKSLILRSLLEKRKTELLAFRRVWDKKGFIEQLAELMEELRTCHVGPEAILACLGEESRRSGSGEARGSGGSEETRGGDMREDGRSGEGRGGDMRKDGEDKPTADLDAKLRDISRLLLDYEDFLGRGWLDLAGELNLLCQRLPFWPRLKRLRFWFDGFHGFTPAEFGVIRGLLAAGRPVKAALTLPGGDEKRLYEEDELFYPTWDTAGSLLQICRKGGFALEAPLYLGEPETGRFAGSPELAALERLLSGKAERATGSDWQGRPDTKAEPLRPGAAAFSAGGAESGGRAGAREAGGRPADAEMAAAVKPDGQLAEESGRHRIRLAGCGDARQEVERMALEILEAAREDKLRYRDMAVLLRRPEDYEGLIRGIFPSYGIPFFFDGAKPLRYHPLVGLLRELTVILRDRWNTGTLMAYTKTGFAGLSDNQSCALENYCLAHGVRRMHWESRRPWRFTSSEEAKHEETDRYMESLRQRLWLPIEKLREEVAQAGSVEDAVAAVYRHLLALRADEACGRMANEALARGEAQEAQTHDRVWKEVMKLFDQTVSFLETDGRTEDGRTEAELGVEPGMEDAGGFAGSSEPVGVSGQAALAEELPLSGLLAAAWESGLEAIEMAALPPSLDQVVICSMDRSRSPLALRVWIPGANEGVIPARIREDSLLDTEERSWLARRQIQLAPDSRRRVYSEAYLLYIALTRASQGLNISFARAGRQGGGQAPSVLLEQLRRFFPGLTVEEKEPAAARRLVRPEIGLRLLGEALQQALPAREPAEAEAMAGGSAGTLAVEGEGAGTGTAVGMAVSAQPSVPVTAPAPAPAAPVSGKSGARSGVLDCAGSREGGRLADMRGSGSGIDGGLTGTQDSGGGGGSDSGGVGGIDGQPGLWAYVWRWFRGRPAYAREMERLLRACGLAPLGEALPAALAGRLFGGVIKTSITRLERYQACPFAHFLAYGLALEPREEYIVRPPEIGNFFHDTLEALMEEIKNEGLALSELRIPALEEKVERAAAAQLEKQGYEIFRTSAWYQSLAGHLLRVLQSSARALAHQESQGSFRPRALEAVFGMAEAGSLPPISAELGENRRVLLRGRIDRIDEAVHPGDGKRYIRVMDYKSGEMKLCLHEIYYGLKMQLMLYMEAALAALPGSRPAGMFYFRVHDPVLQAGNALEAEDEVWRNEKMMKARAFQGYLLRDHEVAELMDRDYRQSLFLPVATRKTGEFSRGSRLLGDDAFRKLGDHSRRMLYQAGQNIMGGDIGLRPYRMGKKTACDFCPYRSVCRFDTVVPGHEYRYLPALSDENVLVRLGTGGEAGARRESEGLEENRREENLREGGRRN